MGFISFGNKFKHRKFDYVPRHYDPDKEELENRLRRYKINEAGDPELAKQRIRGSFRRTNNVKDSYTTNTQRRSNKILLMTLAILLALCYIFLTKYLPQLAESIAN